VAMARALVTDPTLILADEPTGNLDSVSSRDMLNLFSDLNRNGRTVLLITHDADVASHARRIVQTRDGQIVSDEVRHANAPVVSFAPTDGRVMEAAA